MDLEAKITFYIQKPWPGLGQAKPRPVQVHPSSSIGVYLWKLENIAAIKSSYS
jgi:hypothetical protein